MPNVAPRGLFARSSATWKPPTNIFARVAGVWKQADYVWAFHNGAWQLIWGRIPGQPATATATWVQPSTVRIDWTPPAINSSSQWIVRRWDGSIVDTVDVGTLTVTDTRPLLTSTVITNGTLAAYTIEGFDGVNSSAQRSTNTVTYNLTPATFSAGAVTYPTGTTATVTLNWTPNATYGRPQGWQVYNDTTGFVGVVVSGSVTTTTVAAGRGAAQGWRIIPMTQNAAGAWVQAGNVNPVTILVKAIDPASVSAAWSGARFTLRLSFSYPGGGATNYEVQGYPWPSGPWTAVGTYGGSPVDWNSGSGQGYMRVRTLSPGGASDWVQAGPVIDTTGPAPSTVTISSVDGMTYPFSYTAWDDAQSENGDRIDRSSPYPAQLQASWNGGSFVTIWSFATVAPGGGGNSTTYLIPGANRGMTVAFRMLTYDIWGNVTIGPTTATFQTRPIGTFYALAASCDYYTDGVGYRSGWLPYSDNAGSRGMWWYGTRWQDICKGYVPDVASIFMVHQGSNPAEAGTHDIQLHADRYYPGPGGPAPSLAGGVLAGPYFDSEGQYSEWPLPYAFRYPMGVGSVWGMALVDSGGPRRLYGPNANGNSGRITFTFW